MKKNKGTYRSRKDQRKMTAKEELAIITDLLTHLTDRNYHLRLKGEWRLPTSNPGKVMEIAKMAQGYMEATIFVYTGPWWNRKYFGSFQVCTARRHSVYFKRSMFKAWSSYKLHDIAIKHNYNEVMGVNLK